MDAEGNLIDATTGEVAGNVNGAPESGEPANPETETDPETGEPVAPPEQGTDPETGEVVMPPEQGLDPVTGEPLPAGGLITPEQDSQQTEPPTPEEPAEPAEPEEVLAE